MKLDTESVRSRWSSFWFTPESARNLAAARIIIATHALWILLSRDFAAYSALPEPFWVGVPAARQWRFLIFQDVSALEQVLQAATILLLVLLALGIRPHITAFASAILLYHLAPLESVIWRSSPAEHGLDLTVIALIILACSPCSAAYGLQSKHTQPSRDAEYGWALRLLQLFVAQVYLFSGYAKLLWVGLGWASAENMQRWLLAVNHDYRYTTIGLWLAERPVLCLLIGLAALAIDFGFIVAVFSRRARPFILWTTVIFHLGIAFSMNIAFLSLPLLLIFVDWDALHQRVSQLAAGQSAEPVHAGV